jgi:Uma2 family endonuclease
MKRVSPNDPSAKPSRPMSLTARTMTADELLHLPDDGMRHELILGELKTMTPVGSLHAMIVMRLGARLERAVVDGKLGVVLGGDPGFVLRHDPDTVLAPDIAFIRQQRVAVTGLSTKFYPGAPDLAVEVMSPNDSVREVDAKAQAWLDHGALEVWVVNPQRRMVAIHRSGSEIVTLSEGETLESPDLLPGFSCAVRELFPQTN